MSTEDHSRPQWAETIQARPLAWPGILYPRAVAMPQQGSRPAVKDLLLAGYVDHTARDVAIACLSITPDGIFHIRDLLETGTGDPQVINKIVAVFLVNWSKTSTAYERERADMGRYRGLLADDAFCSNYLDTIDRDLRQVRLDVMFEKGSRMATPRLNRQSPGKLSPSLDLSVDTVGLQRALLTGKLAYYADTTGGQHMRNALLKAPYLPSDAVLGALAIVAKYMHVFAPPVAYRRDMDRDLGPHPTGSQWSI